FLIFAIAISHAIQMVNAVRLELHAGADRLSAARAGFRRLALPGVAALASDVAGFLTILWIKIEVVREMALSASLGLGSILLINLILLPVLLSYVKISSPALLTTEHEHRRPGIRHSLRKVWAVFEHFTHPRKAFVTIMLSLLFLLVGIWLARDLRIGDVQPGSPELNAKARYNQDAAVIVRHFSIGMDVLTVFAETRPDGYADYQVMHLIDQLHNYLEQVPGVHAVVSLPGLAKSVYLNWNQGHPKWYVLPRDRDHLILSLGPFDARSGLLNLGGSVMPLYIFMQDHKAETITRVVKAVKTFNAVVKPEDVTFCLAGGNVGVMAATNEAVQAAQVPMLVYLYAAIIALCLIFFRSWRAVICIVAPLVLVSVLTYALMAVANIGLKVATLPVVALGAGIGVDYAIYVYSRLRGFLQKGDTLLAAYQKTLRVTGNAVFFTGLILGAGVGVWIFSGLKFQADMGLLLTFMFLGNMIAALVLLPSLAAFLFKQCGQPNVKY
ncbi:MMPL family transporter, partial [bacterium]|nr:MMPL family transporter [bacterium]